jgi:hypothetical protein
MAHWLLETPTPLLVMHDGRVLHELRSTTGVRQGCSLAPFLFALGIHSELTEAISAVRVRHGPNAPAGIAAILDNTNVWGSPEAAAELTRAVVANFSQRDDLRFKKEADEVIWAHAGPLPACLADLARERGATLVAGPATTRVLGTVLGGHDDRVQQALLDLFVADHQQFLDALRDDAMPLQAVNLLLRLAVASSSTHMLRCTPPALAQKVTTFIDEFTRRTLSDKLAIQPDTPDGGRALDQCFLRLSKGGLGMPIASEAAPVAFWAGYAQASHLLCQDDHHVLLESEWLTAALRSTHASTELAGARAELDANQRYMPAAVSTPLAVARFYHSPPLARHRRGEASAAGIPPPPAQDLQKRLHAVIRARRHRGFVGARPANDPLVKRLAACEGVGGSAWLSACPTTEFTSICNNDFLKAARLRLGLQPVPDFPVERCPACKKRRSFADAPSHLLSCTALMHRNGASSAGHGLVGKAIAHHLRAAGISVNLESQHLKPSRRSRPDFLLFDAAAKRLLTDHTIINPVAYARRTVNDTIQAVDRRKRANYTDMATHLGATFVPLVFSAFGHIPDTSHNFLSLVSVTGSELHLSMWPSGPVGLRSAMLASVSCAIQKRNAHIIAIAAQRVLYLARRGVAAAPAVP